MLICRSCKEPISPRAKACPHCGTKLVRLWQKAAIVLAVLAALSIPAFLVMSGLKKKRALPTGPTPEQVALAEQESKETQEDGNRLCAFRDAQKRADSFQLVKAVRLPNGDLCVHFTGLNVFGGASAERWLLPIGQGSPERATTCDGLVGKEKTAVLARALRVCSE